MGPCEVAPPPSPLPEPRVCGSYIYARAPIFLTKEVPIFSAGKRAVSHRFQIFLRHIHDYRCVKIFIDLVADMLSLFRMERDQGRTWTLDSWSKCENK